MPDSIEAYRSSGMLDVFLLMCVITSVHLYGNWHAWGLIYRYIYIQTEAEKYLVSRMAMEVS